MRRAGAVLLGLAGALALTAAPGGTQAPPHPGLPLPPAPPAAEQVRPPVAPHRTGELQCLGCHQGKHQGVLHMYLGMGGRGTPMIPSHMFQVRVECIACHIQPKEAEPRAGIVGQTFRPSERACVGCHGERYRGMIERWSDTLSRMGAIVRDKLAGARRALEGAGSRAPAAGRAGQLVEDAAFNVQFVTLGKGVHNVFYAADLLTLANAWLDEAQRLLGKAPAGADDTLVRGGYCAVLCHEQAGVKQPETVAFEKRKVPHVRHVTEFGAVCTACHSAEVHKAVTATARTCAACHHGPQNERCEGCHRAQSAFYRGEVKTEEVRVEANSMAAAVACTGCHNWSRKHSVQAVGEQCLACHDRAYLDFLKEWTAGSAARAGEVGRLIRQAEAALTKARRAGRNTRETEALLKDAKSALTLVRTARGVHNPDGAEALLATAGKKAREALARAEAL